MRKLAIATASVMLGLALPVSTMVPTVYPRNRLIVTRLSKNSVRATKSDRGLLRSLRRHTRSLSPGFEITN